METAELYKKYLDSTLHFLSFRSRSEKEVRENLSKKKAPVEIVEMIISWLKEHKFIDDIDFAKRFIDQRMKMRPRSMRIIKQELMRKGIAKDLIEEAISFSGSEKVSDLEMAKSIIDKRIGKYKAMEKKLIFQKLGTHLAGKGFNWDVIKKALEEKLQKL